MYPSDEDVNDNYDFSSREKVHKLFNFAPRHALGLTRNEKKKPLKDASQVNTFFAVQT